MNASSPGAVVWIGFGVCLVGGSALAIVLRNPIGVAPAMLLGYVLIGAATALAWRNTFDVSRFPVLRLSPMGVVLGVGCGFALLILGGIGYMLSSAFGLDPAPPPTDAGGTGHAAMLFVAFSAAAVIEEVAFRGVLQVWLRGHVGPGVAVVLQAVAFSAYHLTPGQIPSTLLYGLVLGGVVQRTGWLGPAVVAHLVLNLTGLAIYLTGGAGGA